MTDQGDASRSKWEAEEWFDTMPGDLMRNPHMSDEQFELLIGRETGIADGANVEVIGLREFLENYRDRLRAQVEAVKRRVGDDA